MGPMSQSITIQHHRHLLTVDRLILVLSLLWKIPLWTFGNVAISIRWLVFLNGLVSTLRQWILSVSACIKGISPCIKKLLKGFCLTFFSIMHATDPERLATFLQTTKTHLSHPMTNPSMDQSFQPFSYPTFLTSYVSCLYLYS